MVKLSDGVVAITMSLTRGGNDAVLQASTHSPNSESILLFGSSDLLLIQRGNQFDTDTPSLSDVARTANWYHAVSFGKLYDDDRPRPFRGFTFFRLHRPQFDRLTQIRLTSILKKFGEICTANDVAAEALLGYGWADIYLDLRAERFDTLFKTVAACREIALEGHAVFRNSFTIAGVDLRYLTDAKRSDEPILPSIALRIAPNELSRMLHNELRAFFPSERWKFEITTGKRDVMVTSLNPIKFRDFWDIHEAVRTLIGDDNRIYKVETHLQFTPESILDEPAAAIAPPKRCSCASFGAMLQQSFNASIDGCRESIGQGLKQSYKGLSHLYRETLEDRDNCCDFDAAAAHFFSQKKVLGEYMEIAEYVRGAYTVYRSAEIKARRRWDLYREAFERLDISSMIIFQQEQNGSYTDLLTRSERVSLFRGGMQKINTVLLAAIDSLRDQYGLNVLPMLCWWPAGQIQSERPIGIIKVPVFYLYQPEIAMFLIVHELGQLSAYEFLRVRPDDNESFDDDPPFEPSPQDIADMKKMFIRADPLPTPERYLGILEERGRDTGKVLTDMFADLFLLHVGFGNDIDAVRVFMFEQFLQSEHAREPKSPRGTAYCVFLVARLIAMAAANERLALDPAEKTPFTLRELIAAKDDAITFLSRVIRLDQFKVILDETPGLHSVVTDRAVVNRAADIVNREQRWLRLAIEFAEPFARKVHYTKPQGTSALVDGTVVQINPLRIPDYFRMLLGISQEDQEELFRARAALTMSVLASCDRQRRLERLASETLPNGDVA
jgi:hypothetical protein